MNRGVPPTDLNARTGEFTPPEITSHACANSRAEATVLAVVCSALPMGLVSQPLRRRRLQGVVEKVALCCECDYPSRV